jgi:hypothetical protein
MNERMKTVLSLLLFLVLALPFTASAQGPGPSDCAAVNLKSCKPLDAFVVKLRNAVRDNDKNAVAALIAYPIEIQVKDGFEIKDKEAFVQRYDAILTQSVRNAIAQEPFVSPRKIIQLVGDGAQVWLSVEKGRLLIDTIIIE